MLRDDRSEFVVDDIDSIDGAADEIVDERLRDLVRGAEVQRVEDVRGLTANRNRAPLEEVIRLTADRQDLRRLPSAVSDRVHGGANGIRIERAAETAIGCDDDDQHVALCFVRREQRMGRDIDARGNRRQHFAQRSGVRPRAEDTFLCTAQLRGRDHLHRLGDLLRVFHAADPASNVDRAWHL